MPAEPRFEWDARKAERNERKHRVSFELAKQVFGDPLVQIELEGYEHGEERWRAVGQIGRTLFVVSYTSDEKGDEETIRIISARRAEPQEHRRYERDS
jgi:uncharacterized DUF497 family protein